MKNVWKKTLLTVVVLMGLFNHSFAEEVLGPVYGPAAPSAVVDEVTQEKEMAITSQEHQLELVEVANEDSKKVANEDQEEGQKEDPNENQVLQGDEENHTGPEVIASDEDQTDIVITNDQDQESNEQSSEQTKEQSQDDQVALRVEENFDNDWQVADESNKWIIQYRYLGVLSQIGIERALIGRVSAGLYYGRYAGKVAGTDKLGFIPGLEHVALQVNAYLNGQKKALSRGLVTRFAIHANRQSDNDLVKSVQVDGLDVIVPGQTRVGTLLGIGYQFNWNSISLNAGMEYLTMGPLKSFVPLAIGVGFTF